MWAERKCLDWVRGTYALEEWGYERSPKSLFDTVALANGVGIYHIQAILGHKSLITTQKYARLQLQDIQRKHRKDGSGSYRQEVKKLSLFENYPSLADRLPYVSLGEFPTPVRELQKLGSALGISQFYIKRDDLSSKVYGGNKPRKLEFLCRFESCSCYGNICSATRTAKHLYVDASTQCLLCPP